MIGSEINMKITAVKTHKITIDDQDIFKIIDQYIKDIKDGSIVAITSKIVALAEGRVVATDHANKEALIAQEAEYFLPRSSSKYGVSLTISGGQLVATAGIDESNANGYFVLWPQDAQKTANVIRKYLQDKFRLKNIGVIITDSKTTPLRWGVTGTAIAFSGFEPLNDLIGSKDLFGRELKMTKVNILDGLAASAVLVMGEGTEQTPLAIIEETAFVKFIDIDPSEEELDSLKISIEDDIYAPLLTKVDWQKGSKV
jgi:putative folate metabolism gamma-glutamate ligase